MAEKDWQGGPQANSKDNRGGLKVKDFHLWQQSKRATTRGNDAGH
jgi:hypothetical protein